MVGVVLRADGQRPRAAACKTLKLRVQVLLRRIYSEEARPVCATYSTPLGTCAPLRPAHVAHVRTERMQLKAAYGPQARIRVSRCSLPVARQNVFAALPPADAAAVGALARPAAAHPALAHLPAQPPLVVRPPIADRIAAVEPPPMRPPRAPPDATPRPILARVPAPVKPSPKTDSSKRAAKQAEYRRGKKAKPPHASRSDPSAVGGDVMFLDVVVPNFAPPISDPTADVKFSLHSPS
ncbi:hypothetical protein B0H17DRAFT_1208482 [Mycena rosella]|uniref:Uncharacterized protein n=1 Tax=Mycena rosella TaxID=1033263 RepID=A0AAD7D136_MYCRO|nr:hypothetical protein B0H17DRAFT_1208482 [Mycena rosella]